MSYQPAESLTNRTFVGLIVAQFLAGFNDQAIHAAAMFYAIHTMILSEAKAITLMPILFFAPWAIFCTISGHMADRYSKTIALRTWKFSEIIIAGLLLCGFYIGSNLHMPHIGGWIVMSCVFLMGTHAAFFAPAKYGAMPEILRPHILSRGNGILESTTFLATILGTVCGGLLFKIFREDPIWIGVIILGLSAIGAAASFLIAWLPPASPERVFPANPFRPLIDNLRVLMRSRPLALAVLGIAFFVFMVSYMRASMYMHGETRTPRWDEEQTSLIVATVALGVGLGSPLAGYLSGGKIELGLVPLGCVGMIVAITVCAISIKMTPVLVVALIIIGFFSGFYMVPLYTLLQHRAPKKSKGELVATSNFVNVTGAIVASILFFVLVQAGRVTNLTPAVEVKDVAEGKIEEIQFGHSHHKIKRVVIDAKDGKVEFKAASLKDDPENLKEKEEQEALRAWLIEEGLDDLEFATVREIAFADNLFDDLSGKLKIGDDVKVSRHELRRSVHFIIRKNDQDKPSIYDNESLPRYLFIGAAFMTLAILLLLYRKLPDFFVRSLFWYQSLGKFQLKAVGMQHLPTEGPVILATNCHDLWSCLQFVSATDRSTKVIVVEDGNTSTDGSLLRRMAQRHSLVSVRPDAAGKIDWTAAKAEALATLQGGHLLAIGIDSAAHAAALETFVSEVRQLMHAPLLPVYCGALDVAAAKPRVRVVFGEPMTPADIVQNPTAIQEGTASLPPAEITLSACTRKIRELGEWIRQNDDVAGSDHH